SPISLSVADWRRYRSGGTPSLCAVLSPNYSGSKVWDPPPGQPRRCSPSHRRGPSRRRRQGLLPGGTTSASPCRTTASSRPARRAMARTCSRRRSLTAGRDWSSSSTPTILILQCFSLMMLVHRKRNKPSLKRYQHWSLRVMDRSKLVDKY
uniref:Uncharacterized protein n=1 Tax=Triticum urartu TaxID=4572 RepID=A0A8R7TZZ6_TRIUA